MNLDLESIGTRYYGSHRHGLYERYLTGSMRRIAYNGKVCQFLQNRDGTYIESISRVCLVGSDSSLTEDNIGIALTHDILRTHEPLLDSG